MDFFNNIKIFSGFDFEKEETTTLMVTVEDIHTPVNLSTPTPAPTNDTPSCSCVDNTDFKFKGDSSNFLMAWRE